MSPGRFSLAETTGMLDKLKLSAKEVIGLVIYSVALAGLYYSLTAQVDRLEEKVADLTELNKRYSLEVIDLKLSLLTSEVKQLNEKADRINSLLTEP